MSNRSAPKDGFEALLGQVALADETSVEDQIVQGELCVREKDAIEIERSIRTSRCELLDECVNGAEPAQVEGDELGPCGLELTLEAFDDHVRLLGVATGEDHAAAQAKEEAGELKSCVRSVQRGGREGRPMPEEAPVTTAVLWLRSTSSKKSDKEKDLATEGIDPSALRYASKLFSRSWFLEGVR